jgi:FkbM family methyltransferase
MNGRESPRGRLPHFFMPVSQDPVVALLDPKRLTSIVDIGANPLSSDGEPPYKEMLAKRLCTLTGFEPQASALATLNERKSDLETYLPYAVGDGKPGILKVCAARGMTSLLTPDPKTLAAFPGFTDYGRVIEEIPIETRTLDSIGEIAALDYLKIDVQGAELAVFDNGKQKLAGAVAIQTEVSLIPFYKDQPVFGDIDLALRAQGFVPHMIANDNKRMILPLFFRDHPYASINQWIEADMVYVRDFTQPEKMNDEQLKHLAIVAHHAYGSYDLAMKCIADLVARSAVAADAVQRYLAFVKVG